ncbi:MAG: helix-turn-helix domain-containing protein, partial [Bacteroidales bacterium]|nr:helix-turn-helix domain-containing protein [Bacteroidales bacterium]
LISNFPSFPSFKVNSFFNDSNHKMWVATEKYGAYSINIDLSLDRIIQKSDGLCNNSVTGIIETTIGEYWISTLNGITLLDQDDNFFYNFSMSNGLPGLVFCPNAVLKDRDGKVWFGNEKGLLYFLPESISTEPTQRQLVISDIYVDAKRIDYNLVKTIGNPVEKITALKLRGKNNSIGFRIVDFTTPHIIESRYATKLQRRNAKEAPWVSTGTKGKIFYNALKPGQYILYFGLQDRTDIVLPQSIKTIHIRIVPEWYQSFKVLVVIIVLISVLVFLYFHRFRLLRSKFTAESANDVKIKYGFSRLDKKNSSKLFSDIQYHITTSQVYLNPDLKINDVALVMQHSTQEISQAINQNFGQGFTDFINTYRVDRIKEELKKSENKHLTLPAIANKGGFNSKSSFYRAFKKVTGQTPADYWSSFF